MGHGSPMLAAAAIAVLAACAGAFASAPAAGTDGAIASDLAELLQSARTVISQHQHLINDPAQKDKGLTPERILAEALAIYTKETGKDPNATDPSSREGRLLRAEMAAIGEVVAENQETINRPGVGFKGFIPAVFARLVNESFARSVGTEAHSQGDRARETGPQPQSPAGYLGDVGHGGRNSRNRNGRGAEPFSERRTSMDDSAFRILVPEYYHASCLSCHGEPAGEMDITGYPKEGGKEGDLGAAISIALFK